MAAHTIVARDKAVRLGGATLRADFNALCEVESATGKAVMDLFQADSAGAFKLSMIDLRTVVQALGRFDSAQAAGDWIQSVGFGAAAEALSEAISLGFGEQEPGEVEPGEEALPGEG